MKEQGTIQWVRLAECCSLQANSRVHTARLRHNIRLRHLDSAWDGGRVLVLRRHRHPSWHEALDPSIRSGVGVRAGKATVDKGLDDHEAVRREEVVEAAEDKVDRRGERPQHRNHQQDRPVPRLERCVRLRSPSNKSQLALILKSSKPS